MSTRVDTKKVLLGALGFFLGACLLVTPVAKEPLTKPVSSPSPRFTFAPSKPEVPLALRVPAKPVPKPQPAWYAGKKILSPKELSFLLYQAGFRGKEHRLAWIVAMGESTGKPKALNKHSCYGLFQIRMSGRLEADRLRKYKLKSATDLFNPLTNAKVAFRMSNQGTNWSAWTVNPRKRSAGKYPGVVTSLPRS